ncbi:MAG: ATP synthase F1 subunit gamma [Deltaproteobacteria bacterium]|nr:ATP synthase F1 subunit gamma [Deltaproteobacteria bacterium]
MPSLKAVRRRIASVKSTQKITRAMKLVAAAKLRRAQDDIIAARPYAIALAEAVAQVALRAGLDAHPMLQRREQRRLALVILTSDRGLCGGFNATIARATVRFMAEQKAAGTADEFKLYVVGRKGRDFFRRRGFELAGTYPSVTGETAPGRAQELGLAVSDDFLNGRIDGVRIIYNEFRSAASQRVAIEPLLPIEIGAAASEETLTDFVYEPSKEELLATMLPLYVQSRILRALLESVASEFGARMTAMESATKNAKSAIAQLTLQYNRARQAAITKELMEIVGGAEALKG